MILGLSRPLRTPFELTKLICHKKDEPDAATLELHALNLLKRQKTSTYVFGHVRILHNFKALQIWEALCCQGRDRNYQGVTTYVMGPLQESRTEQHAPADMIQ